MSKGQDHSDGFGGDITFCIIGTNSWCKCLVGNKILGYEHFLPEQSTSAEEVSVPLGPRWITVIQEHKTVIQRNTEGASRCLCIILFVLQREHVSQNELNMLTYFQHKIGRKMEKNTVVVLVGSEDGTLAKSNKAEEENLEVVLYRCGRKVWNVNRNLEQSNFIKQLIACWKSEPEIKVHHNERTASVEKETWKSQDAMTQEHISGGNQADIKKKNTLTIVLLGQTGSGKSATGNTILRKQHFESRASSVPVTQVCQVAEESLCGIKIRVIDTPDFFDEDLKHQTEQIEVCKQLAQAGPDVYLLVMELGRYTDGERAIVQNIQKAFGAQVVKETIVLFTCKEKLRGKTVQEYVKNTDSQLQELTRACGSRCHAFNNNDSHVSQVERLLEMILDMKRKSGNTDIFPHYSYCKETEKKDCRIQ